MCVQTLYSLQAYIITVLVGLIIRYLWCSIFGFCISGTPTVGTVIVRLISQLNTLGF